MQDEVDQEFNSIHRNLPIQLLFLNPWERLSSRDHRGCKPLPHVIADTMAPRAITCFSIKKQRARISGT